MPLSPYAQIIDHTFPSSIPMLPELDAFESPGGLLLMEPRNAIQPWPYALNELPVNGAALPNLFQQSAQALIGGTVADPTLSRSTSGAGSGRVGRTNKGGFFAQVAPDTTGSCFLTWTMPTAIQNYIDNNKSHTFFVSAWVRNLGAAASDISTTALSAVNMQTSTVFGIGLRSNTPARSSSKYRTEEFVTGIGPARLNAWVDQLPVGFTAPFSSTAFARSGTGLVTTAGDFPKAPTVVLYRVMVIDASVDGRSYAELEALDSAAYAASVLSGRYSGDALPA